MTTRDDLASRLREQLTGDHARGCQGRSYSCDCGYDLATEGLLELAATALEAKDVEMRSLRSAYNDMNTGFQEAVDDLAAAKDRISDLERQLAGETERCAPTSSRDAYGLFTRQEWFSLPMELRRRWWQETEYGSKPASDELITEAKTAIRGGAK